MTTYEEQVKENNQAKTNLELAKIKEKKEREKGFKTMVKGKTSIFVNPKNFQSKLEQGYKFNSIIVSVFKNTKGEIRIVAENADGMLHIFNENQLEYESK